MLAAQVLDEGADFENLLGVKTDGRLIENQHVRVAHQRLRDAHALLVTFGKVADEPLAHALNAHQAANFGNVRFTLQLAFFQAPDETEVFVHRHIRVKRRLLRQIADAALGGDGVFQNIHAVDFHRALVGRQVTGENIHGGGFARAVRAEKTENLAVVHFKADVAHGADFTIPFGEMADLYHGNVPSRGWLFVWGAGGAKPPQGNTFILSSSDYQDVNSL